MAERLIVYIDRDPSSLGEAATQADLDRYAGNLARHLFQRFGRSFEVRQVLGGEVAGHKCLGDVEVDDYVRDLESGEGWIDLL